jgi:hypothetical protein
MSETTLPYDATEPDHDVLDAAWLAAPRRRSRLRVGLLALLAVLLVFLGGIEVQKRWGAGTTSRPAVGGPGAAARAFTGFSSSGVSTPKGSVSTTPAVIGTLTRINGRTWIVTDLGGTAHTVELTASTTLTRAASRATRAIHTGSSVTVQGSAHGRTVTATAITLR